MAATPSLVAKKCRGATGLVITAAVTGAMLDGRDPVCAACPYEVSVVAAEGCGGGLVSPTRGRGINGAGQVAGQYTTCSLGPDEAFLWDGGPVVDTLDRPAGIQSAGAWDISDAGLIVGQMTISDGSTRAYLHDGSQFIDLGTMPGGNISKGRAINGVGQVVGVWGGTGKLPALAAFLWQNGVMTDLNAQLGTVHSEALDINDVGQVVGWMGNAMADAHAFLWEDGAVTDLGVIAGGFTAVASGINDRGDVVGSGRVRAGKSFTTQAFLWDGETMSNLGTLPGFDIGAAVDINQARQIVGRAWQPPDHPTDPNGEAAFIWQNGVMTNLNDLIPADAGVELESARAINNLGEITGRGVADGDVVAFLLTPVAPPAGDLNGDCQVGILDFLSLLALWGPCAAPCPPTCAGDLDGDCTVGIQDFLTLLLNWG